MNTAIEINIPGPVAALATFRRIWAGHVDVCKIDYRSPVLWLPAAGFSTLRLSLWTPTLLAPTGLGILGITLFWDMFELYRQARRAEWGWFPYQAHKPQPPFAERITTWKASHL